MRFKHSDKFIISKFGVKFRKHVDDIRLFDKFKSVMLTARLMSSYKMIVQTGNCVGILHIKPISKILKQRECLKICSKPVSLKYNILGEFVKSLTCSVDRIENIIKKN